MSLQQTFRRRFLLRLLVLVAILGAILGLFGWQMSLAGSVKAGYRDFSFGVDPAMPSGDKPQSKLWWNDGRWWGSLYNPASAAYTIHWLNLATQAWVNTGTVVDTRPTAHMDALWTGQKLYVVSGTSIGTGQLLRYSYDPTTKRYSLDGGFPVTVRQNGAETITIARDSTGQLWITYPQNKQIWVNRTVGDDTQWGQPFVVPVKGVNVTSDDISAVIAFQGNKIGVMWSNQNDKKMDFAVHLDSDADTVWQPTQTALPGPNQNALDPWADDHINLKQLSVDGSGRVFAAIKTSLDDLTSPNANAPLVMLLVRDLNGNWSSSVFGRVQDNHTRPIVLIDEEHGQLYMFATAPTGGGTIYLKTAPLNNISFASGLGTPFIQSSTDLKINNATSTKQNLNSATGLLVLASDDSSNYYLHNYLSLGALAPTPTPAPGNQTLTFTPVADTYVDQSQPTRNFGSSTSVRASSAGQSAYFKFNLTGLSGTVTSAKLRVYVVNGSVAGGTIARVSDTSWSESTMTYNNRPAIDGAPLSTLGAVTVGQWYEFDVTGAVPGNGALSLGLTSSSSDGVNDASREDSTHAPQLVVTTA